jgi:riboflavin transporter FmnP
MKMNTKKLTLTIVFAAIAIVLNPALTHISVMAPFAPNLFYQIWEIPIVIAFLIISPIAGIAVSLLNTSVLFVLFPGTLPTGPMYNLLATLSMQIGIYAIVIISKKIFYRKNPQANILNSIKCILTATGAGILTRVTFMTAILYFALPQAPPIGFGFDQIVVNAYLPLAAFFNATLALYTIPIGWIIAHRVQKVLHITIPKTNKKNNT